MNLIAETVAEFGRSIGMADLQLRENGSLLLALGTTGVLAIEVAGLSQESVIISLTRPAPQASSPDLRSVLASCHHRHRARLPIQAGFVAGQLIAAVMLPQEEFTLLRTVEAIRALDQQLRTTEAAL